MTAGSDGRTNPSSDPSNNLLGRRSRASLSTGPIDARSYGSGGAPDLMIDGDARGSSQAAFPGHGGGGFLVGYNSFFGLRRKRAQQPTAWYNPGGPSGAYGGGWADGILTLRDRHIMTRRGTTKNSRSQTNSITPWNPQADGPPMPEYQMLNTTESWQLGTDNTRNENNQGEHNTVRVENAMGARGSFYRDYEGKAAFPLGTQDGSLTLVMGPPLDTYRDYGVRGPRGMHGPAPDIWDPNWVPARGAGGAGGRGRIIEQGQPGTQSGDRRLIYGGVPHGLHSPTVNSPKFTMARQASIPQMVPPRVDRPNNSRIAGQSYSQTLPPESQAGSVSNGMPRLPNPGRQPGINARFRNR